MKRKSSALVVPAILLILLVSVGGVIIDAASMANSSANVPWAYQMQNQQNTGYSPETKINANNVATLVPAWSSQLNSLTGTPVVSNGVIYVTGGDAGCLCVYAVNQKTGALVWEDGPSTGLARLNYSTASGAAVSKGDVFETTSNNLLVSLNAKTGAMNWDVNITSTLVGDAFPYAGAEAAPWSTTAW
ncbi:MAG: PQQ-binding-like beta-propeller repeat protein [Nitrososphaerales archaeon]